MDVISDSNSRENALIPNKMTSLKEVPTEELLSFQDFTPVHSPTTASSSSPLAQINVNLLDRSSEGFDGSNDDPDPLADGEEAPRMYI